MVAVVTGAELAKVITPWVGVLTHLKGIKSAPQHAIAVERACWQGEAVCAVVARSRAEAEDACALVEVDYEELPAVTDAETALDAGDAGDPSRARRQSHLRAHARRRRSPTQGFAEADAIVETTFVFGRHTGVTNEPRAIVADWNPGEQRLTVYQGTQAPHMMQNLFAKHLGLEEHQVRVLTKDVGGSFGIKVHTYADEMATVALSKLLQAAGEIRRRPAARASSPTSMPATIASRPRSASSATAPSPPSRSTISPASGPIRSIRAPAASRPTRSSISSAVPTPARTIAPAPASCSRTRT